METSTRHVIENYTVKSKKTQAKKSKDMIKNNQTKGKIIYNKNQKKSRQMEIIKNINH